jgi:hypothetical protein
VDPQTVGGATAVVSATVAALALILAWRREHTPRHPRAASAVAYAVGGAGALGVTLVFATASSDNSGSAARGGPSPMTAAQYRADAGSICDRRKDTLRRVERTEPRKSVAPIQAAVEEHALSELRRLRPPADLAAAHTAIVNLWARRNSLVEAMTEELDDLSSDDLGAAIAEITRVTNQVNKRFRAVGLPECLIGATR